MENSGSSSLIETTRQAEVDSFEKVEQKAPITKVRMLVCSGGKKDREEYMEDGTVYHKKLLISGKLAREIKITVNDKGEVEQELSLLNLSENNSKILKRTEISKNNKNYNKYILPRDYIDSIIKKRNNYMEAQKIEDPREREIKMLGLEETK